MVVRFCVFEKERVKFNIENVFDVYMIIIINYFLGLILMIVFNLKIYSRVIMFVSVLCFVYMCNVVFLEFGIV